MTTATDTYGQLWQRFHQSTDVNEVVRELERLDDLAQSEKIEQTQGYELRSRAFRTLQELTVDDPDQAQAMIKGYLLPYCLQTAPEAPSKIRIEVSLYRKRLSEWLDQYPETVRNPIRDMVLDDARGHLVDSAPEGACWTISAIGFRRPDLEEALWELAQEDEGERGDVALSALTSLGLPYDKREALLVALHQRVSVRHTTVLVTALRRLADSASVEKVVQHWLQPQHWQARSGLAWLSLRVLSDVADANDSDLELQDRVWRELSRLFTECPEIFSPELHLGSDLAPRCDSERVIPFLLNWMGREAGRSQRADHERWLLNLRLENCVRPNQLRGWRHPPRPQALSALRGDAQLDSKHTAMVASRDMNHKETSWKTLLCLGDKQALASYETAVADETNPYLQLKLNKMLACLRYDPLPMTVHSLVTEPFDAESGGDSREWLARLSATDLCQSAGTWEAFEALLDFGLTVDGKVLLRSSDALSVVSVALIREGENRVLDRLVETVVCAPESRHRLAAASALGALGETGLLPKHYAPELAQLLLAEDRDALELSEVVAVLGWLPAEESAPGMYRCLVSWAQSRNDWLGGRSLETLARHRKLPTDSELLSGRLGLRRAADRWDWSPETESISGASFVIGLVYMNKPDEVTPAICSILREADWRTAFPVINLLDNLHSRSDYPSLPVKVMEALLDRARRRQTRLYAETDLFDVLARLAPDALAQEPWDDVWNDMLPDARRALADALALAKCRDHESENRALSHLLLLSRDGQYAVRRASYRSLARRSVLALRAACQAWSEAPSVQLRQRAAEACGWLPSGAEWAEAFRELHEYLATDPERAVRETADRVRKERRERLWAEEYLARILGIEDMSNDSILAMWPYGQALMQIGDDGCLQILRSELRSPLFPPHVKYWLRRISKGIEERWRKTTQKWPEPWLPWEGAIEEAQGRLIFPDGQTSSVHCSLWHQVSPTPSQPSDWGGAVWPISLVGTKWDRFDLQLDDGRRGRVLPSRLSGDVMIFQGTGEYPARKSEAEEGAND